MHLFSSFYLILPSYSFQLLSSQSYSPTLFPSTVLRSSLKQAWLLFYAIIDNHLSYSCHPFAGNDTVVHCRKRGDKADDQNYRTLCSYCMVQTDLNLNPMKYKYFPNIFYETVCGQDNGLVQEQNKGCLNENTTGT